MKKIALDISYFVTTGNFCNIEFGSTKDRLFSIGLEPDSWLSNKTAQNSAIWKFGDFEFYFDKSNKLTAIFTDYVNSSLDGGLKFEITNYWLFKKDTITLMETIEELLTLHLDFKELLTNAGNIEVRINNGVYFIFQKTNELKDSREDWTMGVMGKDTSCR